MTVKVGLFKMTLMIINTKKEQDQETRSTKAHANVIEVEVGWEEAL